MDAPDLITAHKRPIATLDLQEENPTLCLESRHNSTRGVTHAQHHRHELVFPLPTLVDLDHLAAQIEAGLYAPLIDRAWDGYDSVWDGRNHVATYTADAEQAIAELADALAGVQLLDVLTDPPEGFHAYIGLRVPRMHLESSFQDPPEEPLYEKVITAYCDALEEAIAARFPDDEVEAWIIDPSGDHEEIQLTVQVSHGGEEVESELEERVREALSGLDYDTMMQSVLETATAE